MMKLTFLTILLNQLLMLVGTYTDGGSRGSLCGNYDDDRAFDSTDADKIYGPILALGTSIIQTDRPEFLIDYLKHKGRR